MLWERGLTEFADNAPDEGAHNAAQYGEQQHCAGSSKEDRQRAHRSRAYPALLFAAYHYRASRRITTWHARSLRVEG